TAAALRGLRLWCSGGPGLSPLRLLPVRVRLRVLLVPRLVVRVVLLAAPGRLFPWPHGPQRYSGDQHGTGQPYYS
ncbi:hypothetical protein, partial [Streptomyces sp. NPDC059168]|uniref:hypothetical protein n=1 Tax=Streptomyces sp. NPDC059168 TaxID=3346753 RepID=UPI0036ABE873